HTLTELDTLGRPVAITDAANGKTKYAYGPFNALHSVTDPGNATTKWTRDAFGRVRQMEEPDRGTTTFINNGFGDLVSSTDALGRVVTFGMDALGRTTTRTDTHAGKGLTTTWTWDTAPNGIGRLHMLESPDGIKTYTYSKRGQLEGMTLSVAGESFTAQMTYDDLGRPKSLEYPWPLGEEPFGVTYEYDKRGHRLSVRDTYTNVAYWQLTTVDDAGRYKGEAFGNGVTTARSYHGDKQALKSITTTKGAATIQQLAYDWDQQLNLKSRTDALQAQNKTERFKYDALNRLTCAYYALAENANAPCTTSYGYAPNGNLTSKSDVGILSYTDAKHPHAVTNAPGEAYFYNAVGNQITRPGNTTITYTPFDLPKTISQPGKTVSFGYDGDEQRIRKTTPTTETLYFEDIFEQVTSAGGKAYRYYVHSPERAVAVVTRGGAEPGTSYLHVDHVGSVETVTNEKGTQVEKRSYDAFGQRRNVIWGSPPPVSFTSKVTKGFTGHEEADEFGLVNMKGRFFDPRTGRFLSTDPIIANVYNGQSFNVYSYVWNNPLAFVDPSGFNGEGIVHQPPYPDIPLPADPITPSDEFRAEQDARRHAPQREADGVGAKPASNDVDTTGNGGSTQPRTPTTEDDAPSPFARFIEGAGERAGEIAPELALGLLMNLVGTPASPVARAKPGSGSLEGAGERMADAVNEVNPLYTGAIDVIEGADAYDSDDYVGMGQAATGVGVTIVMTIITWKGAKTTRGPPKATDYSHIADPKNIGASTRPTPRQVREMKAANRAENGGELRSDLSGKPMVDAAKSQRGVTPPPNEVQVDHIAPVDKGGTRTQSNLQLITREENRIKWNR
ncbi:MAG: type IV secretion protein Rhs, partial [Polyangiaceae bacterium]|nr:type IV secretion protein Rhs [Polyangiaceae bacterium]